MSLTSLYSTRLQAVSSEAVKAVQSTFPVKTLTTTSLLKAFFGNHLEL